MNSNPLRKKPSLTHHSLIRILDEAFYEWYMKQDKPMYVDGVEVTPEDARVISTIVRTLVEKEAETIDKLFRRNDS
jgi:hypothetical protein